MNARPQSALDYFASTSESTFLFIQQTYFEVLVHRQIIDPFLFSLFFYCYGHIHHLNAYDAFFYAYLFSFASFPFLFGDHCLIFGYLKINSFLFY